MSGYQIAMLALWGGWGGFMAWMGWQMFVAWPRQERAWDRKAQEERDALNAAFAARREESRRLEWPQRYPEALRRAWER